MALISLRGGSRRRGQVTAPSILFRSASVPATIGRRPDRLKEPVGRRRGWQPGLEQ